MSKRGPDFQHEEATQSLWDMDGMHIPKRYRNKGKGRGKDKRLVRAELVDSARDLGDNGSYKESEG